MAQKKDPFIGSNYGWENGEDGWGDGMNDTILLNAFLHNRRINGSVSSLPSSPVNGDAYFLTTDLNTYFRVDGLWKIFNTPVGFKFILKSTEEEVIFDGAGLVPAGVFSLNGKTGKIVEKFNTRIELVLANTDLSIGDVVETKGCDMPGDGGHGTFDIVASTTRPVDGYGVIDLGGKFAVIRPNNGVYYAAQFGALTTNTDNGDALQRAADFVGDGTLVIGHGTLRSTKELLLTSAITIIGVGKGYLRNLQGEHPNSKIPVTRILFDGTGTRTLKTRIAYRGSASDPHDAPISTGINVQMDGVTLSNFMVDLYCDYSDDSPTNYGAEWDVGVFHGSRQDFRMVDINVGGYWRESSIWLDSTRGVNLPEMNDYPVTFGAGADGISLVRVCTIGGKWGARKQGPRPKEGLLHFGFQYKRAAKFVFSGNPANGDTVTVGSVTLTFRTTPTLRTDVQIGVSTSASIANLTAKFQAGILTPYDTITYTPSATELKIYSTSATATALAETSASITIQTLDGVAATQTETISDPARYYDDTLGLVDDGRCSLGASDTVLENCVICSVEHHSKRRKTDFPSSPNVDTDTNSAGALWVDGLGGNAVIHRFFATNTRFQSVEPFCVKINHAARCRFTDCTTDSAVTRWKSTTGAALTESDTYGKYAASRVKSARIQITGYDDPGDYFPLGVNGNQVYSHFYLEGYDINAGRNIKAGGYGSFGNTNTGSTSGYVEVLSGASGNAELRFGNETQPLVGRIRVSPSGGMTIALRPTGGSMTDVLFLSSNGVMRIMNTVPVYADDAAAGAAGLSSGSIYRTSTGQAMIKI